MKIIALIPARCGSVRLKDKNIKVLHGKPLICHTIDAAINSKIFEEIFVISDSSKYLDIASNSGALTIYTSHQDGDKCDYDNWLHYTHDRIKTVYNDIKFDVYCILRPTNPFRTAETIVRAWERFKLHYRCDSMRSIELVKQHPFKTWQIIDNGLIKPFSIGNENKFILPYQVLPKVYIQNGCIEMVHKYIVEKGSICGKNILPFFTIGNEGFDINTEEDFIIAEKIIS